MRDQAGSEQNDKRTAVIVHSDRGGYSRAMSLWKFVVNGKIKNTNIVTLRRHNFHHPQVCVKHRVATWLSSATSLMYNWRCL